MGLQVGDRVPSFEAKDETGATVSSADIFGEGPVVLYFYPKDDTPVCTAESCRFRDDHQDFLDAGAKVYGVSADSVASHKAFKEKHKLPFSLLADTDNALRKLFGVPSTLFIMPGRVTYVIDREGVIRHIIKAALSANKHVDEALASIKSQTS